MLIYLDTNIVIYLIEQPAGWGPRATARVATMMANADRIAVSDLHRMECLVAPLAAGVAARVSQFNAFFASSDVSVLGVSGAVCERAASIRATHRFRPLDALHPAAAAEHGCGRFLTNDTRLNRFTDVQVEVLP